VNYDLIVASCSFDDNQVLAVHLVAIVHHLGGTLCKAKRTGCFVPLGTQGSDTVAPLDSRVEATLNRIATRHDSTFGDHEGIRTLSEPSLSISLLL